MCVYVCVPSNGNGDPRTHSSPTQGLPHAGEEGQGSPQGAPGHFGVQYDLVLHTITSHCNVSSQREQNSRAKFPGFFFKIRRRFPARCRTPLPSARPLKLAIGV